MLQGPWYPAGKPATSVPVAAVAYLEHHPGRVFSTYLWNDYLDWVGRPVFVDGRTELYTGDGVLATYLAVDELDDRPRPVLHSYHVRYVLWPPGQALSVYLGHDRRLARGVALADGRGVPRPPPDRATRVPDAQTAQPVSSG